jgi:3-oxoacyl-[acyl-carrier-protein] synthase-3
MTTTRTTTPGGEPTGLIPGPTRAASILGLGYFLPEETITNADLSKIVDTSDEWITARTGIRSRRRADAAHATSDLAAAAARAALADAGLAAGDIDMVLLATATPDSPVPATACRVQRMLGATSAAALDLNAGCSGFLYGLHMADSLVASGAAGRVLVIGAEILTRVTDYTDRRTCVLFGDGAGACVVGAESDGDGDAGAGSSGTSRRFEILRSIVGCDGEHADMIEIPGGGSRSPASERTVAEGEHFLRLDGRRVFKQAVRRMVESAQQALDERGMTADGVDWLIPHQANERILTAVAEQLAIPVPRVVVDVAESGNTSAASVPIALGKARDTGAFEPGQHIVLVAFGAGLTWACQLIRVAG